MNVDYHMLLDTTAGLLSFAFCMLSRRKDLWKKTRTNVLEHYCEPLPYEARICPGQKFALTEASYIYLVYLIAQ